MILVDEYDKPLVNNLHDEELFVASANSLRPCTPISRAARITSGSCSDRGQPVCPLLSVFSGLNNITDISFTDAYSGICGISRELVENFQPGIKRNRRETQQDAGTGAR